MPVSYLRLDWSRREVIVGTVPPGAVRWDIFGNNFNVRGTGDMAVTMTVDHMFNASVQPVDSAGNPARVDGVPGWGVSDDAILEVIPSEDGLSADVVARGAVGNAQVTVSVDADLGEGVRELTGILDVEVLAGEAVAVNIAAGPLTQKSA